MINWPSPYLPPINLYNAPEQTMKRPRRWLEIDGQVNVLSNHLRNHGFSDRRGETMAKSRGMKTSEITLDMLSKLFGCEVKEADQPANWQEIMYGSRRGAQKHVPKGKKKGTYAARKAKEVEVVASPVQRFMAMHLSRNPAQVQGYY